MFRLWQWSFGHWFAISAPIFQRALIDARTTTFAEFATAERFEQRIREREPAAVTIILPADQRPEAMPFEPVGTCPTDYVRGLLHRRNNIARRIATGEFDPRNLRDESQRINIYAELRQIDHLLRDDAAAAAFLQATDPEEEWSADRAEFERLYGDGGCTCPFTRPPCGWCEHPGNPAGLE